MKQQRTRVEPPDPAYHGLYKVGGIAALVVVVCLLAEIVFFAIYPQPATVDEWFTLLQDRPLVGLLDFWALEVVMYAMFALMFPALYIVLRQAGPSRMVVVLVLALLGIAVFFATNNPVTMLSLSHQHAAAATEAERSALLAAGQAVLANTTQRAVGGFNLGLLLVYVAGLIASWVMLRGQSFTRTTAYLGLAAHALSLADYVRQALTSAPLIALLFVLPGALLLAAWCVLVGRRLYQLGAR